MKKLCVVFLIFLISPAVIAAKKSTRLKAPYKTKTSLSGEEIFAQTSKEKETDYYSKDSQKYKSKKGIDCNEDNCLAPSYCSLDKTECVCGKHYANYPFSGVDGVYCLYERHSQLTSFLLELCLNIGIGHFIIGNKIKGTVKLLIVVIPFIFCLIKFFFSLKKENSFGVGMIIVYIFIMTSFCWWIADAIMFGTNKYRDKNSVPLQEW